MENNTFNIIIAGVGGQGLITLLSVIDESAFAEGYDVRSSELHGLSQRGGSVEAHIRFGKKACPAVNAKHSTTGVNSPLVSDGSADLIISLEMLEGLRQFTRAGKNTKFLVNKYVLPFEKSLKEEEIKNHFSNFKNELHLIEASQICKEKLQNEVVSTIYLFGYAINKKLIPFKKESALKAINNIIPEKYRALNIKAFELAHHDN